MDNPQVAIAKQLVKSAGTGWIPNAHDVVKHLMKMLIVIRRLDLVDRKDVGNIEREIFISVNAMVDYFQKVKNSRKKPRKSRKTNAISSKQD
jgi:hypothetical protein